MGHGYTRNGSNSQQERWHRICQWCELSLFNPDTTAFPGLRRTESTFKQGYAPVITHLQDAGQDWLFYPNCWCWELWHWHTTCRNWYSSWWYWDPPRYLNSTRHWHAWHGHTWSWHTHTSWHRHTSLRPWYRLRWHWYANTARHRGYTYSGYWHAYGRNWHSTSWWYCHTSWGHCNTCWWHCNTCWWHRNPSWRY